MNTAGSLIKKISNTLEADKNRALKGFGVTNAQFEVHNFLSARKQSLTSQKDIIY